MYTLRFAKTFPPTYKLLIQGNQMVEKRAAKALRLLKTNPSYPSLKSHKVATKHFGKRWSSRVTGDLRIIWDFDENNQQIIIVLVIATHSGTHKEYK